MKTREQVLTEFPLKDGNGLLLTAQMVQIQTWHNSLSNPRWIDGYTLIRVNGEDLVMAGDGTWVNPETGETFSTA